MGAMTGRTVVVTRTRKQAGSFSSMLKERGARVYEVPTIAVAPTDPGPIDQAIAKLESYDWLFFTSANGVDIFFERCPRDRKIPLICSIGPATSDRVRGFGREVTLQPSVYQAEGILEEFTRYCGRRISGLKILLPRARVAREILPRQLRARGAEVDLIPVYETVIPEGSREALEEALAEGTPDLVTFTSSSTVHNFMELSEGLPGVDRLACAVIGPITERTAHEYGLNVVCRAKKSTIPDLVEAIDRYFTDRKG